MNNRLFLFHSSNININYDFYIYGASTINNPRNNTVIFLKKNSAELLKKLKYIKDSILIILENMDAESLKEDNIVIYSNNPRLEYAKLLTKILEENKKEECKLTFKEGYYYGENCYFGNNVIIEPFVTIGSNVTIEDNTIIKSGARIGSNIKIGKRCYIKENCVIGGEGFGIEKDKEGKTYRIPHIGGVEIGDNVEIGALTTVCRGTIENTIIEDYVKIDDHVYVAHNVFIGKGSLIVGGTLIGGSTKVGKNCWISPNTAIKNGLKIGNDVTLGMAARVLDDVKDKQILTNEKADTLENIKKFVRIKERLLENNKI
ncbi:UDP-3-O-(3-hydroxymyristoyl)glucosamine N-acyltransferase [Fusobacterium nucleatum]|nr:UDP-3-O-(3-hydroxymyristoyl) glucosamine N-acyltransferase [Fusobacterium nucleatum subsp. nucleatum]AVQ23995.1 UDP-3-O-(3-hydroxymyristoyl)glucosamine N-acyltransferase [Fusobacterium nucleatum subsp. nucleatum ATCC 23726]